MKKIDFVKESIIETAKMLECNEREIAQEVIDYVLYGPVVNEDTKTFRITPNEVAQMITLRHAVDDPILFEKYLCK